MNKTLKTILSMFVFVFAFLFFSSAFDWIKTGVYSTTSELIEEAIILGVVIPPVYLFFQKIKNSFVFVGVTLVYMFAAIFALKSLFALL